MLFEGGAPALMRALYRDYLLQRADAAKRPVAGGGRGGGAGVRGGPGGGWVGGRGRFGRGGRGAQIANKCAPRRSNAVMQYSEYASGAGRTLLSGDLGASSLAHLDLWASLAAGNIYCSNGNLPAYWLAELCATSPQPQLRAGC